MFELLIVAMVVLALVLTIQGIVMLTLGRQVVSRQRAGVSLLLGCALWIVLVLLIV